MSDLEISERIDAPIDRVFYIASDFPNMAEHIEAINKVEMLTEGPVGAGTRFRETRTMFGREATEEMEVAIFEPPTRYAVKAESHGSRYWSEWLFSEVDGETEVKMTFDATPVSFFAKVMSVLMRPMMKKALSEMCSTDLRDLKKKAESSPGAD